MTVTQHSWLGMLEILAGTFDIARDFCLVVSFTEQN